MTNDNRRKHTRVAVDLDGTLVGSDGKEFTCQIINLSVGGALVAAESDVSVGDAVSLHCCLGRPKETIAAQATVRWISGATQGIQFMPMGARETYFLTEFLAKQQKS